MIAMVPLLKVVLPRHNSASTVFSDLPPISTTHSHNIFYYRSKILKEYRARKKVYTGYLRWIIARDHFSSDVPKHITN